ncbi:MULTISPECIES: DUF5919 domain-containing protein [Actinoalloteichus]|uniref:DUF5919 domain-containing protein n=1 Tax=Actinoalloteichus fjordicus TaxID=1612552 RepID=A0AAC9L8R7_9PSEU|nr:MULTISPECIES: DUF5919 domain-containing protein [Actinoalloteichus]APU12435.1 hypothetical protein UA74_01735 [Actinoalloteichus fjordicus]APU18388.1 hypothetical protein UA75_01740 [Actinoalloteichus sp. GBA129-24]
MVKAPIALKVLLRKRHLQGHTAFCKEYDKQAKAAAPDLVRSWPSKTQFYRWLSGDLRGLPYAHHCRILELMFPEWTAEALFEPYEGGIEFVPDPADRIATVPGRSPVVAQASVHGMEDVAAVFGSRPEFAQQIPPHRLFDGAESIRMAGLSLNVFCQQYSDRSILEMISNGGTVEALFLDPDGEYIKIRNEDEGHPVDTLSSLTAANVSALTRLRTKLDPAVRENLQIRVYDEVVRFNITTIDDRICIVQTYLPNSRGVESPTFVIEKRDDVAGLFATFTQVYVDLWGRAREVAE